MKVDLLIRTLLGLFSVEILRFYRLSVSKPNLESIKNRYWSITSLSLETEVLVILNSVKVPSMATQYT